MSEALLTRRRRRPKKWMYTCLKLEHTQNDARKYFEAGKTCLQKHHVFGGYFCDLLFLFFEFRWCRWCHHLVFFHWWTPWTNLCCERFIGAHRLQPVGFGSHFRWLGRVFQPIFICFFKNPKANHQETGCMKTDLKTLSEIMGSLSTNKPTDAYSSLPSSLVNAGFVVAINRMVCVLFFWLQKFCFLGLGWTSGNDSVPTHPTCRSQWGVPKSRCGVFVDFLRWKMCGCFFFHLEKKTLKPPFIGFFYWFFSIDLGVFFPIFLFWWFL